MNEVVTVSAAAEVEPKAKRQLSRRTRIILIVAVLVALVAAGNWGVSWWTVGRHQEETNNAFLEADAAIVAPKVGGYVTRVLVAADQPVVAGQPLAEIDRRPFEVALARPEAGIAAAEADLQRTRAEISRQGAVVWQGRAQAEVERRALALARTEAARFSELARIGADTIQRRDETVAARDQTIARLAAADAATETARRQSGLLSAQIEQNQAALASAVAARDAARLDLDATSIRASQAGRVGDKTVVVGQYVQPGTRLMSIVPTGNIYVVANFKETQLATMRVGQKVRVSIDALPDTDVEGVITSMAPGTGSRFALLRPENATGNFTKIVQRVPVRVALRVTPAIRARLVPGLSANVSVDTRSTR